MRNNGRQRRIERREQAAERQAAYELLTDAEKLAKSEAWKAAHV